MIINSTVASISAQEVAGLIPAGSSNILLWRLIISEGQLSVSGKRMCTSTG